MVIVDARHAALAGDEQTPVTRVEGGTRRAAHIALQAATGEQYLVREVRWLITNEVLAQSCGGRGRDMAARLKVHRVSAAGTGAARRAAGRRRPCRRAAEPTASAPVRRQSR